MMSDQAQSHLPYLSIVMPVFQEETTLRVVILQTAAVLRTQMITFEIVAVEDGSQDNSFEILRALQQEIGELRIVQHLYNRGYGSALRTGIRCARGEIVLLMDADGQHNPADIPAVLAHIPPYDMVVGFRTASYQGKWYRNFGNRFYNWFASWLTHFQIRDLTSGFRAMRRSVVLHFLPLYPTGFSASLTATMAFLKAGYNVKFVPIHVLPRLGGQSKVRVFRDGARFFSLLLRILMLYDPMRIFFPLSAIFGVLGLLAMAAGILDEHRFFFSNSSILFFFSAIFVFLNGLIANQNLTNQIRYFGDESVVIYDACDGKIAMDNKPLTEEAPGISQPND